MNVAITDIFAATIEKTERWLDELTGELGWSSPERAYAALRAVLHALRDRLSVEEAVDLGAQLPMLVRGFYYEGWRPAGRPLKYRHKEDFLQQVAKLCPALDEYKREPAVRAVFKLLARHVSSGEIRHVLDQLPAEIRELWKAHL